MIMNNNEQINLLGWQYMSIMGVMDTWVQNLECESHICNLQLVQAQDNTLLP